MTGSATARCCWPRLWRSPSPLLGTYTWTETAPTPCPAQGVCLEGQTHRIHPLRARIEWAAAIVMVVGAASLAVTGRRKRS